MIASSQLQAIGHVRHGFFTRQGGRSQGLYASLNCGFGSDDARADVAANRAIVAGRLGVPSDRLLTAWQWHSADVEVVHTPWNPLQAPRADSMVTEVAGIALGVLAADCTPVLLADREVPVVGAAHAGWKGALGGVVETTIAAMERLGAVRRRIVAAVGPSISQASYEVGPEFHARFVAADKRHAGFFQPSARAGHYMFDLPGFVRARLAQLGLAAIEDVACCTYAEEARFFSYRRTTHRREPDYGRQISAIAITR